MSSKELHLFEPCPECNASGLSPLDDKARLCLTKGLKPGTCGDWIECLACHGKGTIEIVERIDTPSKKSLIVDGFRR